MYPIFQQTFVYKMYTKCLYRKCIPYFDKLLYTFCIHFVYILYNFCMQNVYTVSSGLAHKKSIILENYHPIFLLPITGEIFERILYV